jgi:hypothetical protein
VPNRTGEGRILSNQNQPTRTGIQIAQPDQTGAGRLTRNLPAEKSFFWFYRGSAGVRSRGHQKMMLRQQKMSSKINLRKKIEVASATSEKIEVASTTSEKITHENSKKHTCKK